jgi:hypothetical protein
MFWLDLCLSGFFLWGGVSGYLAGWKISLRQMAALAATFVTAVFLKGDMKQFITLHTPIEEAIKALIISRIAVPVDSVSPFQTTILELIGLPGILQGAIAEKSAFVSVPGVYGSAELLAAVMLNALAFAAAAVLWWGLFHLAGVFWPMSRYKPLKHCDHWAGLLVGTVRHLCLVVLVVGAVAPFLWLPAFPKEIFDPQEAVMVRWSLQLFNDTGIWWN